MQLKFGDLLAPHPKVYAAKPHPPLLRNDCLCASHSGAVRVCRAVLLVGLVGFRIWGRVEGFRYDTSSSGLYRFGF